ncbi:hypothetical protein QLX67_14010, partial [Balneolaceae bacterium ANBcel3]|nr:hypothetical protein [Balneolaceae bacterium ANBcel3]
NVFVVETGNNRILKLSNDGTRLDSLGRAGRGDYQLDGPSDIDPSNELKIYVSDRNNRRIQVFDQRFQYLATVSLPVGRGYARSYRPNLLDVDQTGRLFFYDEDSNRMFRYENNGQYDLSFELFSQDERVQPIAMSVFNETLWILGRQGTLLHRFTSSGSYSGFIHLPEPAVDVRVVRGETWILGTTSLMKVSRSGEVLKRVYLDGAGKRWIGFDLFGENAFILTGSSIYRIPVTAEKSPAEHE